MRLVFSPPFRPIYLFFFIICIQIAFLVISHVVVNNIYNLNSPKNENVVFARDGNGNSDGNSDGGVTPGPQSNSTNTNTNTNTKKPPKPSRRFHRYEKVVIVTKVHWSKDLYVLKRMLCLFNAAYNQHVNYDIIVFTTVPWSQEAVQELQSTIPDTKLQVVIDGPSSTGDLGDYLVNISREELSMLEGRCGKPLSWFNHCNEEGMNIISNLAYNWQSEFRAYHIYKHEALKPYRYMIWMDSDALCTESWKNDPMELMVKNNLTIMFPNFPAGKTENPKLRTKIETVYNQSICHAILNREGFLWGKKCKDEHELPHFQHVHGFHHITNLDVYRKEIHLKFLHLATVGEYKFSRLWDDQLGVTVPAVMDTPGKAWDYAKHNITTNIFHHGDLDGKGRGSVKNFPKWWRTTASGKWNEGKDMCDKFIFDKRLKN